MRICNLYAGIGGNRKLWTGVEVTAVEKNPRIAEIYSHYYPDDTVIVGDAHQYLQDNYQGFDFIWSSPPCQSHSSIRQNLSVRYHGAAAVYPDMKLWQEIIFLRHNAQCLWVVENVRPYYKALIDPSFYLQRHPFWSNFYVPPGRFEKHHLRRAQIPELQKKYGFDLSGFKISNKRQILRNCVCPDIGLHILNAAMGIRIEEQLGLFSA